MKSRFTANLPTLALRTQPIRTVPTAATGLCLLRTGTDQRGRAPNDLPRFVPLSPFLDVAGPAEKDSPPSYLALHDPLRVNS